jgi:TPR repeat protein
MGRRVSSAAVSVMLLGAVLQGPLVPVLAASTVDPRVVGTWEGQITNDDGTWTLIFIPQADGSYRIQFMGPASILDETGTLQTRDGRWSVRKTYGQTDGGSYTFSNPDTVTFKGHGPAITWRRVGTVSKGAPDPAQPCPASPPQAASAGSVDPAAERFWERGSKAYSAGEYRGALFILQEAAQRGHPRAQALLGIMYREGKGVAVDAKQAAYWFVKAAAQGHRAAQFALADMYDEGDGVPKDEVKAAKLRHLSACQGFPQAQAALGLSYELGKGVPRNRQAAIYWLDQAAKQGVDEAHWISDWLKRPDTPHFQNELQLAYYISAMVGRWMATSESVSSVLQDPDADNSKREARAAIVKQLEEYGRYQQAEGCRDLRTGICP